VQVRCCDESCLVYTQSGAQAVKKVRQVIAFEYSHRHLLRLALCVLTLCAPVVSCAEVHESFNTRHYDVTVVPGRSLNEAVTAASTVHATASTGKRFHAYTDWYVRWNWRHREGADGQCRIVAVDVRLTGSMLLPRIRGGSADQVKAFEQYLDALRLHEEGHQNFGRTAAREIDEALRTLPAFRDCETLGREANARANKLLARQVELERRYDQETGHGRTQGAVLKD
jgi:predicted secreted Zn-dependent protease